MPVRTSYNSIAVGPDPIHFEMPGGRLQSGILPRSYFLNEADDRNIIFMQPGMLVAECTGGVPEDEMTSSQPYYVPFSPTAAYGTGSDTAVGIVRTSLDFTLSNQRVTPVYAAWAHESRCYCAGGARGDVPDAAKTDLSQIKWR